MTEPQQPNAGPDEGEDDVAFERPERPALDDRAAAARARMARRERRREEEQPVDPDDQPAPVVMESGTFGILPEDEPLLDLGDDGWLRGVIGRIAAAALLVVATGWLLILSAHQVTDRPVATPALERGVAALTEIDELLAMHQDAIAAAGASRAGEPDARIEVPGFPIRSATLTAAEARDLSVAEQRELILERAATAVYDDGLDVFLVEDGEPVGVGLFSTEGFARRMFSTLAASTHDRLGGWLRTVGLVAIALAAAVVLLGRGFARYGLLAVPLVGAAAVGVAAALALRLAATLPGGDGGFADELSDVAQTLAWTPARNALWFALAAAAVALPAIVGSVLFPPREEVFVAAYREPYLPDGDDEPVGLLDEYADED